MNNLIVIAVKRTEIFDGADNANDKSFHDNTNREVVTFYHQADA